MWPSNISMELGVVLFVLFVTGVMLFLKGVNELNMDDDDEYW